MSVIDEIKQKLDIVEYIGEYISLKASGRNFKTQCPFHVEKTPSFFVFPDQQSWHCFGACGTGGDIFSFLMKKDDLDFGQALHILADKAGVILVTPSIQDKEQDQQKEILYRINEEAAAYYHHILLKTTSGEFARTYLTKRDLSAQTIEQFQLGYSLDSFDDLRQHLLARDYNLVDIVATGLIIERDKGGYYDRFRNRITFPIRDINSHVIGFGARAIDDSVPKYLNTPQTIIFDKSNTLYGIDRAKTSIRQKNLAIITEGYMDVITSHQHGWDNTVASMGTALTEKQLVLIKKLTKNIILALDADIAGEEATMRIASIIDSENYLQNEVKVVVPSKGKDVDEEIRQSATLWAEDIKKGRPLFDFIIDKIIQSTNLQSAQGKSKAVEKFIPFISKMNEPIRRGHYIQTFAQSIKINEADLRGRLEQLRSSGLRKRTGNKSTPTSPTKTAYFPDNNEMYCLGLLLRYPEIRTAGINIPVEYFEYNENRDIFSKWKQDNNVETIRDIIDPLLLPHWDSLLSQFYPPDLNDNNDKQRKELTYCITRMKEKYLKNLVTQKGLLLATEAEQGGKNADLSKLQEQGCDENPQLKETFIQRSQRQKPTISKE